MNELQLTGLEQTEIVNWDFEGIKEDLKKTLSIYETTVYTDETIKTAKSDKATLAKAKKIVEDQRKAFKTKCLEPYDALEPKVKEIVGMIEEQRIAIDSVVKEYTERQKQQKQEEVKKFYMKKASPLGDLAEPLFEKVLDPKWLNATTTKSKYSEEVIAAVSKVQSDLTAIKAIKSPFEATLIEKYVSTLSLDEVKAKQEELVSVAQKAGLTGNSGTQPSAEAAEPKESSGDGETVLKIRATEKQLDQVFDFMSAIGVAYEVM